MSASVEMSWDDANAPVLNYNTAGSIIKVLKACLVDGYGETPSLGWELVYISDDGLKAVFRPKVGSRMFVQVDDNWIDSTNNSIKEKALVYIYESMDSINNGIERFPPESSVYRALIKICDNIGTNPGKWKIIGDNQGFYWIPFPWGYRTDQYANIACVSYIGSYIPIDITNQYYNFVISASEYNKQSGAIWRESDNNYMARHSRTLERGSYAFRFNSHFGNTSNSAIFGLNHDISPVNGKYLYEPIILWDQSIIHGWMPGLFNIMTIMGKNGNTGILTANSAPFYDQGNDHTFYVFCSRYNDNDPLSSVNRLAIIVGEGFRNAY